ncbi:unnamed protein product [Cuscuta epithymum]|uniref:Uncharacterized protein n=1 Tax=Cuscuta epithymum TaxID=186058 RepID=A0AAV0D2S3_9ASTE|nr:unnamed protein product [Cuscuta epithymum]
MAGCDSQKQLLSLIRDFASEKSQGERRISNLKIRIGELLCEIEAAHANLEEAKHVKESIEQELKGYEVELAMNEASIQTLEARIASTQEEISAVGSDVHALKNEEIAIREDFIKRMLELNAEIRRFYDSIGSTFSNENFSEIKLYSGVDNSNELKRRDLENKVAHVNSQITVEKEEYQTLQNVHKQLQEELTVMERRVNVMEAIMKESIERQELNEQTGVLENQCASLGDELQRKLACPKCHQDNSEQLGGILGQVHDAI